MTLDLLSEESQLNFFIGGLGAGKTDIIINLSIWRAKNSKSNKVYLIDLDIVNPFFRVRKLQVELEKLGVTVISPEPRIKEGDLPALPASAWGLIIEPNTVVFCDVGGGELGVRPLARLKDMAIKRNVNVFAVINPYRPGFQTPQLIKSSLDRLENISGLKITHIIANPHLVHETSVDVFNSGLGKIISFSNIYNVPIAFAVVSDSLLSEMKQSNMIPSSAKYQDFTLYKDINIFSIVRFWQLPWYIGVPNLSSSDTSTNYHREV